MITFVCSWFTCDDTQAGDNSKRRLTTPYGLCGAVCITSSLVVLRKVRKYTFIIDQSCSRMCPKVPHAGYEV